MNMSYIDTYPVPQHLTLVRYKYSKMGADCLYPRPSISKLPYELPKREGWSVGPKQKGALPGACPLLYKLGGIRWEFILPIPHNTTYSMLFVS